MKWNGIELHVGDKVRLTDKRPFYWNQWGKMDMYLGQVVTIKAKYLDEEKFIVERDYGDDCGGWVFRVDDIDSIVSNTVSDIDSLLIDCEFIKPEHTAVIKIGNLEINLTDKTFTKRQIKNMKEMLGWDVTNLKEEKE